MLWNILLNNYKLLLQKFKFNMVLKKKRILEKAEWNLYYYLYFVSQLVVQLYLHQPKLFR